MTTQRQISVTSEAEDVPRAFAWALGVIEAEKLVNPSVGVIPNPRHHCPCPNHFADDDGFQVQVTGVQWTDVEEETDLHRHF